MELVVGASLEARDHIDGLEHVQEPVVIIYHRYATDIASYHLAYNVENAIAHAGDDEILVGAKVELAHGLLQQYRIMFVVDGNKLKDAVLSNDRHHPFSAGFVVNIDKGDSTCSRVQHAHDRFEKGRGWVDRDSFDGNGAYRFLDICNI